MATKLITDLPAAQALTTADVLPIVQSGHPMQTSVQQLADTVAEINGGGSGITLYTVPSSNQLAVVETAFEIKQACFEIQAWSMSTDASYMFAHGLGNIQIVDYQFGVKTDTGKLVPNLPAVAANPNDAFDAPTYGTIPYVLVMSAWDSNNITVERRGNMFTVPTEVGINEGVRCWLMITYKVPVA